jgi:hypothetical protein
MQKMKQVQAMKQARAMRAAPRQQRGRHRAWWLRQESQVQRGHDYEQYEMEAAS